MSEVKEILRMLRGLSTDDLIDVFEEASAILAFRELTKKQMERLKRTVRDMLEYDFEES